MDETFLDLIYQAPTRPAAWVDAMVRLADLMGGTGAWLSTINVIDGEGHGLWARTDPRFPKAFFGHFAAVNPLNNVPNVEAFMRDWRPRIVTEDDLIDPDLLRSTEFYNDFQKPLEATSVAMIRLARHPRSQSTSVINIGRAPRNGRFEARELETAASLHAHMIRAFRLSMEVARAKLFAGALGQYTSGAGRGVVVVDETGAVLSANATAEATFREGALSLRGGRLAADDPASAARLKALVAEACAPPPAPRTGGVLAVPQRDSASPLMVSIAPLRDDTLNVFLGERLAVALVSDPARSVKPAEHTLRALYGLTPAEARLALALLDGATLKETAATLGVSVHTAGVQLSRVFEKVDVNRQSSLAVLLTRVALHG